MSQIDYMSREESRLLLDRVADGWTPENRDDLNDNSRLIIQCMHKYYGQCWLGQINPYTPEQQSSPIKKYRPGQKVGNYHCDFVIPKYDAGLVNLITYRDRIPYQGADKDMDLVKVILERIDLLKGVCLFWS